MHIKVKNYLLAYRLHCFTNHLLTFMNYCSYAVSVTIHLDVSGRNYGGMKRKAHMHVCVSPFTISVCIIQVWSRKPRKLAQVVTFLNCILKVTGFNLGKSISYLTDSCFGFFSPSGQVSGWSFKVDQDCFLPNPSQTTHCPTFRLFIIWAADSFII